MHEGVVAAEEAEEIVAGVVVVLLMGALTALVALVVVMATMATATTAAEILYIFACSVPTENCGQLSDSRIEQLSAGINDDSLFVTVNRMCSTTNEFLCEKQCGKQANK